MRADTQGTSSSAGSPESRALTVSLRPGKMPLAKRQVPRNITEVPK
jgi:hypothetical protein